MSKRINSKPRNDGFRMPAEFEEQQACWMIWPERTDNWWGGAKPAQKVFTQVANTIVKYEKVNMLVSDAQFDNARYHLNPAIRLLECSNDDAWMRDTGPTFVINQQGEIRGVDWIFNSWGGFKGGLHFPWAKDDHVARKTCDLIDVDSYRTDFVLEGGSIHTDGEGTLFTTEECLLNKNRNPDLTKAQIEENLKNYLNVEKVIWLPLGVYQDETSGHVDNMLHVVAPGHVVLTWTDDQKDPQYERSVKALEVLENTPDAQGRKIKVTKLQQPNPLFRSEEEAATIDYADGGMKRKSGTRLPASYANFLIANKAVILPIFDCDQDDNAIKVLQKLFPDRQIEPIFARDILLGGGNIHCITQNQPATINQQK